jgi:cell division protein FtsI/penicillin-binding protein 2
MASERREGFGARVIILRIALIAVFILYTTRLFSMQILSGDPCTAG